MKLLRLLSFLLAFSSTLFFLCWPTRVFADAQISDWVGQYTMNHDGFVGKLEIQHARRKCNTSAWCALILRYTDAKAVPSMGRIESVDQNFQHMVFYLEFPGNPQKFDAYLFSWDKNKMAGTTYWGGHTFGMFATKDTAVLAYPAEGMSRGALVGGRTTIMPHSIPLTSPAPSGVPTRTIKPDGTYELRYPDGTVKSKRLGACGYDTRFPDGRFVPARCVFMSAVPPTMPPLPNDDVTATWLKWHDDMLSSILRGIFGNDQEAVSNYFQNYESGQATVYDQIATRTKVISDLASIPSQ